ncbi:MAG: hypothetical protein IK017_04250 [Paludibacteraceae bacterium]|nr:hypothetical protein [Paludibacteraceae bacterium]MBR5971851.1 hypothetical protein [Paludibacteraceae bacterium]
MAYYNYIGNYPYEKKTGWERNVQGICHDDKNWYISQTGELWKIPVTHDLDKKIDKNNLPNGYLHRNNSETSLKNTKYNHYGDIDFYQNYLFVPITSEEDNVKPAIAVFEAKTLTYICKQTIKRNDGKQYYSSLAWCAIKNGKLYTSDRHCGLSEEKDSSPIEVYDIDIEAIKNKKNFLKFDMSFSLWNNPETKKHFMQGGCFDNNGYLHLNSGIVPGDCGEVLSSAFKIKDFDNENDGIQVFRFNTYVSSFSIVKLKMKYGDNIPIKALMNEMQTSVTEIARSCKDDNKNNKFRYEFHPNSPKYEEPEGITFWDLRGMKNLPNNDKLKDTVFHALMLDNEANNNDEVYIKHYRYE